MGSSSGYGVRMVYQSCTGLEQVAATLPTRSDAAYDSILEAILSGAFPGGAALSERRLGDELGLSRTPVREALGRLEVEGFVTRRGRASIVRTISVQEFLEILHLRHLLEVEAVGLACGRLPAAELDRLRCAMEQADDPEAIAPDEHRALDDAFHGSIARHAGNGLLADTIMQLRQRTRMFNLKRIPERFLPGRLEHLAILDALDVGDPTGARHAMATHLDHVKAAIFERLLAIGRRA